MKKLFSSILLLLSATSLKAMEQNAPKTNYWYSKVGAASLDGENVFPQVGLGRHFEKEHLALEIGLSAAHNEVTVTGFEANQLWYFSKPTYANRFYLGVGEQVFLVPLWGNINVTDLMVNGIAGWRSEIGSRFQFIELKAGSSLKGYAALLRDGRDAFNDFSFMPSISYGISF